MIGATALLGHRGCSADHPENTLCAFRHALKDDPRADGFECDVRLSADGIPMVFHDDETQRLTGQPGTLEHRSRAAIGDLDVRGEPIPTLDGLLHLVDALATAPLVINIELKPTGHPGPLIAACRAALDRLHATEHTLVVSSFDPRVLDAAFDAAVPWRLAFLYETLGALGFLDMLDRRGPLDLHPLHCLVDAGHLARYHTSPFDGTARQVRTWTVDDPHEARRLVDLGVDALITNVPQRLARALQTPRGP